MKKEIKAYLDDEYTRVYSDLNVSWKLGVKNKTEELINKGLTTNGFRQQTLTTLGTELIRNTNIELKALLEETQIKFDIKLSEKDLNKYINKSIKNNNSYLDKMEKELSERFDEKGYSLVGSIRMKLNNAKNNSENELKRIERELVLINNNKHTKISRSDKIAIILGIIGIAVTIVIFILD